MEKRVYASHHSYFCHSDSSLSTEEKIEKARLSAEAAHKNYWTAMEGTLHTEKVKKAVDNTVYGNPKKVAEELKKIYDKEERLMLWFDFNNHNNEEVKNNMRVFKEQVIPLLS